MAAFGGRADQRQISNMGEYGGVPESQSGPRIGWLSQSSGQRCTSASGPPRAARDRLL